MSQIQHNFPQLCGLYIKLYEYLLHHERIGTYEILFLQKQILPESLFYG